VRAEPWRLRGDKWEISSSVPTVFTGCADVLLLRGAESRTLALGPLLLLLLASGWGWCLLNSQRLLSFSSPCRSSAVTYHFVGYVVCWKRGQKAGEVRIRAAQVPGQWAWRAKPHLQASPTST
jgi:hypothetical protein